MIEPIRKKLGDFKWDSQEFENDLNVFGAREVRPLLKDKKVYYLGEWKVGTNDKHGRGIEIEMYSKNL